MGLRKAGRRGNPLKIGVSGPSGSGKTMSSLYLAKGLVGDWESIAVLDTENESADLYSDLGDYSVLPFSPPHSPARYVQGIDFILKKHPEIKCLIIDSASHEWDGEGGCLQMHEAAGGRYQDWSKVNPYHKKFVDKILFSPIHVIVTTRRKQDYAMEQVGNKTKVKKLGMKEIQRDGFEYELTVGFDVDISHRALASKDRTNLFATNIPFVITEETGRIIKEWNQGKKAQENEFESKETQKEMTLQ